MSIRNRIYFKGSLGRQEEALAASTVTPGMLVELNADGKIAPHSVEGGVAERAYAIEDALQGGSIDKNYLADEILTYILPLPGDVVQAWLAAGENVEKGDHLISKGDGTLQAVASAGSGVTSAVVVAVAEEALDLSGSGAVAGRIAVRVL